MAFGRDALVRLIREKSEAYGLSPDIVWGVVMTESGGNPHVCRYEPAYRWTVTPAKVRPATCSVQTEEMLQKMSIGLMQVMGSVYRELGYRGWLTALFSDPEAQVDYGCRHLKAKISKWGLDRGLSAYNAGVPTPSNADYVQKVKMHAVTWQKVSSAKES